MLFLFKPGKPLESPPIQAAEVETTTLTENRLHIFDPSTKSKFLVDSGSVISLLPRSAIKRKLKPQPLTLTAANSSSIATFGTHRVDLNLDLRREFSWDFTVADVNTAILGADFLAHFNLLVDLKNKQLIDAETRLSTTGQLANVSIHSVSLVNSCPTAPGELGQRYLRLLDEFSDLTRTDGAAAYLPDLPVHHQIMTKGPPVFERPRRLIGPRLAAAKKEFKRLMDQGIIRPSSSQWASPLHLVPKPDGSFRVTGDYRRLNACTIPDRYPLPIVEDILQEAAGNVFSVVDLRKAFYQIKISEEDIPKTAVTTPFGLFEFTRSSLGQRNAAQSLQRTMDHLLRDLPFARCYLDDIIIFSDNHDHHLQHLRQLFERLRSAKLRINPDKCTLGKDQVVYLGYSISADGFKPPARKIQAITDFPKPTTSTELRRFLGLFNYYRRCVPKAANILAPLNSLLQGLPPKKKNVEITWTPEADDAFQRSKDALAAATTSTFLRLDAPLAVRTDASDTAIGAAVEQLENGIWRPLAFFSRKLSPTERKRSTYDRELLAIEAAYKHFLRLIEGREFTTFTDHKPLIYAAEQRSDKASPRQARQLDFILQFNTRIVHVKGEENVVADALSRVATIDVPALLSPRSIAKAQADDPQLQHVIDSSSLDLQLLKLDDIEVFCDISTGVVRPFIPPTLRRSVFEAQHNLAHPSPKATTRIITAKFVWPHMRKDISRWARNCESCQRSKIHRHNRSLLGNFNLPEGRFDHIHIDLIKLPLCQGNQYCLTVIDRFSRWPEAIPLPDQQATTVARALIQRWISTYGTPLTITSDQGAQFESALFTELTKFLGAKRVRTTPYHPQSNGMVERTHRTIKAALMSNSHLPWPDALPLVLLGLRTTYKEDLQASPAEMLYGTTLRIPGDFFFHSNQPEVSPSTFVEDLRRLAQEIRPSPASRHISENAPFFFKDLRTCSHVFKRVDSIRKPLQQPYTGPHKVVHRVNDRTYVIEIKGQKHSVSTDALKPAYLETADNSAPTQSAPAHPATSTPAPTASSEPPSPPPPAKRKRVTFSSCPPAEDRTGGRVVVASQRTPASRANSAPKERRQARRH